MCAQESRSINAYAHTTQNRSICSRSSARCVVRASCLLLPLARALAITRHLLRRPLASWLGQFNSLDDTLASPSAFATVKIGPRKAAPVTRQCKRALLLLAPASRRPATRRQTSSLYYGRLLPIVGGRQATLLPLLVVAWHASCNHFHHSIVFFAQKASS